jgi:hypothetical protein
LVTEPERGADQVAANARPFGAEAASLPPAPLLRALLEGLPAGERSWVIDRIRHYRALAAAEEVSEGRL